MALSTKNGSTCNEFFWILNSFLAFGLVNRVIRRLQPQSVRSSKKIATRWTNTATSLVHGTVSGLWCLACVLLTPEIITDLIEPYSSFSQAAVAFSVGYFLYDCADIVTHKRNRKSLEMLLHHVVVITCLGTATVMHHYIGFAIISLMVEVNSAFLHWRQCYILTGVPKTSLTYSVVKYLNIGSFVIFRISTFVYMLLWHYVYFHRMTSMIFSTLACTGIVIVFIMNFVMLYRIVQVDIFDKPAKPAPACIAGTQ